MSAPDRSGETAPDPVREFTTLIPRYVTDKWRPDPTAVAMVHAAIRDHAWTPAALARYCSRELAGVVNPASRVLERLRHAAGNPPQRDAKPSGRTPLCDRCEDGWEVDEKTRLPMRRCPCRTGEEKTA